MPRGYKLKFVLDILKRYGFIFVFQSGAHAKYRKSGKKKVTVIVPIHGKEIPYGTFRSILCQSGLKEEDFQR